MKQRLVKRVVTTEEFLEPDKDQEDDRFGETEEGEEEDEEEQDEAETVEPKGVPVRRRR